jgi:mannose-1-phosphate guanylyltransferase / mannose-6-phosphate isomerase
MPAHPSLIPVVLAGGSGTRLWPLSREEHPKQLLALVNERTMLQNTLQRLAELGEEVASPLIVCTEEHRFLVAEQVREVGGEASILIEPLGRDTAPAVAVAAHEALGRDENALLLILPADHVIGRPADFARAVQAARPFAEKGSLVTFGIVPASAHTGYGYIKKGAALGTGGTHAVAAFVEKPGAEQARQYLAQGYLWNSGMFLFRAAEYLRLLAEYEPQMHGAMARAHARRRPDLDFIRLDPASFAESPANSIDYAVMEKAADRVVVPLDCAWSDVGSWEALWEIGNRDADGNVLVGNVLVEDVQGSLVHASDRIVAAIGLRDHIVVETKDAVLVATKERAQEVKKIVRRLQAEGRAEARVHPKVSRPWGTYECLDRGQRFQVKRIVVNPGASLSLQRHFHRAEHWVVVRGTARIGNGDQELILSENQSTYIPLGVKHRLQNPGAIPLEIIEIQTGSYLGEDDIERFDDVYGRG